MLKIQCLYLRNNTTVLIRRATQFLFIILLKHHCYDAFFDSFGFWTPYWRLLVLFTHNWLVLSIEHCRWFCWVLFFCWLNSVKFTCISFNLLYIVGGFCNWQEILELEIGCSMKWHVANKGSNFIGATREKLAASFVLAKCSSLRQFVCMMYLCQLNPNSYILFLSTKTLERIREQYSDCPFKRERTIPFEFDIAIQIAFLSSLSLSPLSYISMRGDYFHHYLHHTIVLRVVWRWELLGNTTNSRRLGTCVNYNFLL